MDCSHFSTASMLVRHFVQKPYAFIKFVVPCTPTIIWAASCRTGRPSTSESPLSSAVLINMRTQRRTYSRRRWKRITAVCSCDRSSSWASLSAPRKRAAASSSSRLRASASSSVCCLKSSLTSYSLSSILILPGAVSTCLSMHLLVYYQSSEPVCSHRSLASCPATS
ncbi:Nucleoporin [Alternaria alternata]|nr:Nucleoporin [Alternaria alternata]